MKCARNSCGHEGNKHPLGAPCSVGGCTCPGFRIFVLVERPADYVEIFYIDSQREAGWPDIHPEDYCHNCGFLNPSWYAPKATWDFAMKDYQERTGREGIVCPTCFQKFYEAAIGEKSIMMVDLSRVGDIR